MPSWKSKQSPKPSCGTSQHPSLSHRQSIVTIELTSTLSPDGQTQTLRAKVTFNIVETAIAVGMSAALASQVRVLLPALQQLVPAPIYKALHSILTSSIQLGREVLPPSPLLLLVCPWPPCQLMPLSFPPIHSPLTINHSTCSMISRKARLDCYLVICINSVTGVLVVDGEKRLIAMSV